MEPLAAKIILLALITGCVFGSGMILQECWMRIASASMIAGAVLGLLWADIGLDESLLLLGLSVPIGMSIGSFTQIKIAQFYGGICCAFMGVLWYHMDKPQNPAHLKLSELIALTAGFVALEFICFGCRYWLMKQRRRAS